jgi:hypothetical protein
MEPPGIVKYRRPRARLTKNNRKVFNEYGLVVPSKKSENYEPNVNDHAVLWNSGMLPGKKTYNYRNKVKVNKKTAWNEYLEQRGKAETKNNKNKTRRTLFN